MVTLAVGQVRVELVFKAARLVEALSRALTQALASQTMVGV